jgi:hypothetical protein
MIPKDRAESRSQGAGIVRGISSQFFPLNFLSIKDLYRWEDQGTLSKMGFWIKSIDFGNA